MPLQETEDGRFCDFVQLVRRCFNLLKEVGKTQDMDNNYVIALLEQKLCPPDKRLWVRYVEREGIEITMANLLDWLTIEMKTRIRTNSDIRCPTRSMKTSSVNQVGFNQPVKPEVRPKCWLCNSDRHYVDACPKFLSRSVKERFDLLKEHHCCFSCLKKASRLHRASTCSRRKPCGEESNGVACKNFHHRLLHSSETPKFMGGTSLKTDEIMLPVATLKISAHNSSRLSNVMFDSGAQVTLIREAVAKELDLPGRRKKVSIMKVGGEEEEFETKVYDLRLHSFDEGRTYSIKAIGIDCISAIESRGYEMGEMKRALGISGAVPPRENGPIDLLVGVDHGFVHTGYTVEKCNLVAKRTPVGWIFYGGNRGKNVIHPTMHVSLINEHELSDFWSTESMGVNLRQPANKEFEKSDGKNEISCELSEGQWTVSFPWIRDPSLLPDNRSQAEGLLFAQERRLLRTPNLAKAYNDQIEEMTNLGFARKLTQSEIEQHEGPVFYLPHHAVIRKESLSTPLRIVFNSSIVFRGHCLNEYWAKGPDLFNDLFGILLRFRENRSALVGDISKMYHRIRISESDKHVHRFLWRNFDETKEPDIYVMNVLSFGDKPAPAMALTALRKSAEVGKVDVPVASDTIQRNSYMDDICTSVSNSSEALQLSAEIDQLLNRHGFTIKKWVFNNVPGSGKPASEPTEKEKVLGLMWDVQLDEISLKFDKASDASLLTKRTVLSKINKIFDPLGLAAALLIRAKIGLQDLWRTKLGWDEPLSAADQKRWQRLLEELDELKSVEFPRCVMPVDLSANAPMLCIFSDASEEAFGACAYLRWEKGDGAETKLLCAKSRVAPLKKLTIPKLELQGAVLASRLCKTIKEEIRMHLSSVKLFTDSMIALSWILNGPRKSVPFVSCRVQEILDNTTDGQWFHIPGNLNVADQVSRGIKVSQLDGSWSEGPEFLSLPEKDWPVTKNCEEEQVRQEAEVLTVQTELSSFIDFKRISSWKKLKRATGYVLRFISNLKCSKGERETGPLSVEELEQAEKVLIGRAQAAISKKIQKGELKNLTPFTQDGFIRVGGRLGNADFLTFDSRHPVLLPGDHPISKLIMRESHEQSHCGVAATLAKCRRKFWICKGHALAKSVLRDCVTCKKLSHIAHSTIMASLPQERLRPDTPPFFHTSVDYFGPYAVKVGRNKRDKHYGVIFTCMNSRAVHLEMARDASADEFIQVLRRFFAIRGFPSLILSDNGTQMVGAERQLREMIKAWDKDRLREFCADKKTKWKFTTPLAPHQNGCTESLVKTCKRAMKVAIGEQVLTPFELYTFFLECANIVNQRPIGRLVNDPNDGSYLCPNDLLLGRASAAVPPGPFRETSTFRDRVELVQQLSNSFWKRFCRDVIPMLVPRKKWLKKKEDIKVGDVVVTADSNPIRGRWSLGRIVEVFEGRDGCVRNVRIRMGQNFLRRPISKVAVILPC